MRVLCFWVSDFQNANPNWWFHLILLQHQALISITGSWDHCSRWDCYKKRGMEMYTSRGIKCFVLSFIIYYICYISFRWHVNRERHRDNVLHIYTKYMYTFIDTVDIDVNRPWHDHVMHDISSYFTMSNCLSMTTSITEIIIQLHWDVHRLYRFPRLSVLFFFVVNLFRSTSANAADVWAWGQWQTTLALIKDATLRCEASGWLPSLRLPKPLPRQFWRWVSFSRLVGYVSSLEGIFSEATLW